MGYLVLGCIGFLFLYIFDYNKVKRIHEVFNSFFIIGISIIGYASLSLFIMSTQAFSLGFWLTGTFYVLSVVSALFMFYALFGALPFKSTYVIGKSNQTVDTGMYALCRHPGVWGFFFMYFFMYLARGDIMILYACILWTFMDIIHVWIQDVYFFPKTLSGYLTYQETTPFLLFNKQSLKRCMTTFRK